MAKSLSRERAPTLFPPPGGCHGEAPRAAPVVEPASCLSVWIAQPSDVVRVRCAFRALCRALGFSRLAETKAVTAVSELARYMLQDQGCGSVELRRMPGAELGVELVARERRPVGMRRRAAPRGKAPLRGMASDGLGAVQRLMGYVEVVPGSEQGPMIIVRMLKPAGLPAGAGRREPPHR